MYFIHYLVYILVFFSFVYFSHLRFLLFVYLFSSTLSIVI